MPRSALISALLLASLSLSLNARAETDPWANYDKVLKTLPKDAAATLDRGVSCNHFSGEINGDNSAADKQTFREMKKLKCGTVDQDIASVKNKYKNNKAVVNAIQVYYEN
ncbi:hypothetical protein [Amantichitinum ursilacus]|uniref:Acid stress chaperone HdeA n=1 Tax=Amantichitinum ursilacus TaxID=857265 RepID=A0A0N0GLG6_9NEIS|nr:hypothetical protein [Amantichitinum ursilacus]KPC50087.1 hypothetical protein WG78_18510 [Amantichitinum ursilacus]